MSDTEERTGWVGLVVFGGVLLALTGGFQMMQGFVAILRDEYFYVTRSGLLITMDYTAWGWVHLGLGLIAVGTGIGVLAGQMWARVVGIIIGVLSALVNLAFLSAYPIWSTIIIALDVLVIYALTMHGGEVEADR
ncbi:hypothetical protein AB0C12_34515 [Actinoplanes sp. NPDC048967]|uniref:DUF7144 family membrane protein n=1 Tax=Actinoplanes sp. NPDC048967 TaxID=3155269 RepID=UPI0033F85BB7